VDCPLPQWGEVKAAADFILSETERQHVACVVLGSGLSDWAEAQQDSLEIVNIPHFPKPTVPGHAGRVFSIVVNDQPVLVMAGRVHSYEYRDGGLDKVVFAANREDVEAIGFDEGIVPDNWANRFRDRKIEVVENFMRPEAAQVLRQYAQGGTIYNG